MINSTRPLLPLTRRWFVGASGLASAVVAALFVAAILCLLAGTLTVAICVIWIVAVLLVFVFSCPCSLFSLSSQYLVPPPKRERTQMVLAVLEYFSLHLHFGSCLVAGWSSGCWHVQAENAQIAWGLAVPIWVTCLNYSWFLCKLFLTTKYTGLRRVCWVLRSPLAASFWALSPPPATSGSHVEDV